LILQPDIRVSSYQVFYDVIRRLPEEKKAIAIIFPIADKPLYIYVDSGWVAFETVYAQNGIGQKRLMSGWRQGSTHHGRNGLSAVAEQVCFPRFF